MQERALGGQDTNSMALLRASSAHLPPLAPPQKNNPWELLGHWRNIIQIRMRDQRRLIRNKMECVILERLYENSEQ